MSARPASALLLAALVLTACESSKPDYLDPTSDTATEAELAAKIEASKRTAREAAIADMYRTWGAAASEYERKVADRLAAAGPPGGGGPVRTVEELMAAKDPASHDPALRELAGEWTSTCDDYERRLRELGNDPRKDPRSPTRATE